MSLPHVILTVLSTRDATGYDITKEFSHSIGYFWKASHQQVYRELNKMAQHKLVTHTLEPQEGKPDKKIYSITDAGRQALTEWFKQPTTQPTIRDEFSSKLVVCALESDVTPIKEQVIALIRESQQLIDHYKEIEATQYGTPEKLDRRAKLERLTLVRNIALYEAWIRWAEEEVLTTLDTLS